MEWLNRFPSARLYHLASSASDHCYLMLRMNLRVRQRKTTTLFHFEAMWLKDGKCGDIVKKSWAKGELMDRGNTFSSCMDRCREALTKWNRQVFGHVGKKLAKVQELLQTLEVRSVGMLNTLEVHQQRAEVNHLLDMEQRMWKQRSCNPSLKEGDKNARFFHEKAITRKQCNTILGVMDENDTWHENEDKIAEIITGYYQKLFTTSQPIISPEFLDAIHTGVTPQMNQMLTKVFTAAEVKKALDQMYLQKSPRSDGMPPLFYQHFWLVVGDSVVSCVLDFLNNGTVPLNFHETHIVLIPKVKSPTKVSEYRHISLSNVVYKLTSKVLPNRFKTLLPSLITKNQSSFPSERLITNNVLVAFEIMNTISQKKSGKTGSMALKLDMSKAFDRVEWSCLEQIMRKMGFHPKWITMVMKCVTSVKYSIRINGVPHGSITPSRGLCQREPSLSLFVFLFFCFLFCFVFCFFCV